MAQRSPTHLLPVAMPVPIEKNLSDSERHGLIGTVVAGFLSTVMSGGLLLYVLYRVFRMWRTGRQLYPITLFYMSLLFWGIFQGMGWVVSIPWIQDGRIVMGAYCVTQAVIKQLGTSGIALSTIAMSCCIFHDYVIDAAENLSLWHGYMGLGVISLIQVMNIAIPNAILRGAYRYYGISGYWCWIANNHYTTKIVTHYLWYWSAGLFSLLTALTYFFTAHYYRRRLPVGFLWIGFPMKGSRLVRIGLFSITFRDRRSPDWSWSMDIKTPTRTLTFMLPFPIQYFDQNEDEVDPDDVPEIDKRLANKLIWFPITYLMVIIPQSIVRFLQFSGKTTSKEADFAAATIIGLTGVIDVTLFLLAKPAFGLADEGPQPEPAHELAVGREV